MSSCETAEDAVVTCEYGLKDGKDPVNYLPISWAGVSDCGSQAVACSPGERRTTVSRSRAYRRVR